MKNNILIFLISGKAQNGKGTVSKILKEKLEEKNLKVCEIQIMRTLKGYLKDYLSSDDETAKKTIEESCSDGKLINKLEEIKKEVYKCDKHFEVEVNADNNIGIKVYTLNKDKITYDVKYEHKVIIEYNNKERKYLIKGVE